MITLWTQAMLLGLVLEILLPTEAADLRSKAAREAAEYVLKKFGKEVAEGKLDHQFPIDRNARAIG